MTGGELIQNQEPRAFFFQITHRSTGCQGLGHLLLLPRHKQGAGLEMDQLGCELMPKWNIGTIGKILKCHCISSVFILSFKVMTLKENAMEG